MCLRPIVVLYRSARIPQKKKKKHPASSSMRPNTFQVCSRSVRTHFPSSTQSDGRLNSIASLFLSSPISGPTTWCNDGKVGVATKKTHLCGLWKRSNFMSREEWQICTFIRNSQHHFTDGIPQMIPSRYFFLEFSPAIVYTGKCEAHFVRMHNTIECRSARLPSPISHQRILFTIAVNLSRANKSKNVVFAREKNTFFFSPVRFVSELSCARIEEKTKQKNECGRIIAACQWTVNCRLTKVTKRRLVASLTVFVSIKNSFTSK